MTKSAILKERVKKGSRRVGTLYIFKDGRRVFLTQRRLCDIQKDGAANISDAIRNKTAGWAIEEELVSMAKSRNAQYIGVSIKETGHRFITTLDRYIDRTYFKSLNYRNRTMFRVVPFSEFRSLAGKVKI